MGPSSATTEHKIEIAIAGSQSAMSAALSKSIELAGMKVRPVAHMSGLLRFIASCDTKIVVIDASGGAEEVFNICRHLRGISDTPIVVLLSKCQSDQVVAALDAGADDCFTPALSMMESVARIRGLLRRAGYGAAGRRSVDRPLIFAGYKLDPVGRILRDARGSIVDLTAMEFDLLLTFCRRPGRIMRREELLALTHAGLAGSITRSVDVHVSRLRQKIEQDPKSPMLLKTVRLGGYVFVADVRTD